MAVYVLVPGGFGGSWIWREVARSLWAAGHEAYTPSLTGMGERVHLANPDINLSTWVEDVINEITFSNLDEVILVGFSFGGMTITGVAEKIPEHISKVVYLDAYVPEDGLSAADLLGPEISSMIVQSAQLNGEGWKFFPVNPSDPRLTFQPLKTGTEKLCLKNPEAVELPRVFIYCTEGKTGDPLHGPINRGAEKARNSQGWSYYEIEADHKVLETHPHEVAGILLDQARVGANSALLSPSP
jgi:pimeloyl-ACP methyl ester carboxylesterase